MSKKTEQIYKAISSLEDLRNQISIIIQLDASKKVGEYTEGDRAGQRRHLENIEFEMGQAIKSLRFWIGSLYSYNGKSTSNAKVAASKENGKKGGRPPKEISDMRKKSVELERLIEDLRQEKILTTEFEREEQIEREISAYEKERSVIEEKLEEWSKGRKAL